MVSDNVDIDVEMIYGIGASIQGCITGLEKWLVQLVKKLELQAAQTDPSFDMFW